MPRAMPSTMLKWGGVVALLLVADVRADDAPATAPVTAVVFHDAALHFDPAAPGKFAAPGVHAEDNGRVARTSCVLPAGTGGGHLTAHVTLKPVPKSEREVHDRIDRAGNVRLLVPGRPDVEIMRFMTAYGGRTEFTADVTELAPLLTGTHEFRAFVDTWVSPAWTLDFELRYEGGAPWPQPVFAAPVYYTESYNAEDMPQGAEATVQIPAGLQRVVLKYTTTGHCTDGIDADEFIPKPNVIAVDGVVVARFHPWRDDCRQYRDRNPFTSHWTDGRWSSDYSRSGWCPGTRVEPVELDLTDHLTPGPHRIKFRVENVRPKDAQGAFGYWRLSAYVAGWKEMPDLWHND